MATGGAIKAGEAFIELSLRGARNFGQRLNSAIRSMGRLAAAAARVGVAMSAAFGAAALVGIRRFVQLGDQMGKMSARTGASAEALSRLAFAAEQSGTDIGTVERSFIGMARAIRGLERGLSTQVDAFESLGLTLNDLQGLEPDKQFELIGRRLTQIEDPTRRAAIAMEVFGRAGTQVLTIFGNLTELQQRSDELGRTITDEQAKRAERLADRWNEVRSVFLGFLFDIVDNFAPAIESMLVTMRNFLLDWKIWLKDLQIAWEETVGGFAITFEDETNSVLGSLASAAGVNMFNFAGRGGTTMRQQSQKALTELRRQRRELIEQGRPSSAFTPTSRTASAVQEGIERAQRTSRVGGTSFGSFAGDTRQFGIQSVGRRQLRVLQQIEDIQERQLQILEQTGFLAFL